MPVSKAYLRRLYRVVKDRTKLAAIRKFLSSYRKEINTNNLVITRTGEVFYRGTIDGITCYKIYGRYRKRKKSSLDGKRFRKDKAFKGSRESAERFALGNRLASRLYMMVDEEKKAYKLFCFLKKRAIELIREGKSLDETRDILLDYLTAFKMIREERRADKESKNEKQIEKFIKPKFLHKSAETKGWLQKEKRKKKKIEYPTILRSVRTRVDALLRVEHAEQNQKMFRTGSALVA